MMNRKIAEAVTADFRADLDNMNDEELAKETAETDEKLAEIEAWHEALIGEKMLRSEDTP